MGTYSSLIKEYFTVRIDDKLHMCLITVVRRLTTERRSEICVVRRFRRCANVTECTYTNPDSITEESKNQTDAT